MPFINQSTQIIPELENYLKYGLPGLSAIALILGYLLLFKEQSRSGQARNNILSGIKLFMGFALLFLLISASDSLWDRQSINQESASKLNGRCNKKLELKFSLSPEATQHLNSATDEFEFSYRKWAETKWTPLSVHKTSAQAFTVIFDSIEGDEIPMIKFRNVTKNITWHNRTAIPVSHTSTELFHD